MPQKSRDDFQDFIFESNGWNSERFNVLSLEPSRVGELFPICESLLRRAISCPVAAI